MGGFKLVINSNSATLNKFSSKKLIRNAERALDDFGGRVVGEAKTLAPKDEGELARSINYTRNGLQVIIEVNVDYAAYVEFGTRRFAAAYIAQLPKDWQTFAAQFKGKTESGSLAEFVERIMAWALRKGIGSITTKSGNVSKSASSLDLMQAAAYAIALNILQNGIKPHPYLFPAVLNNTDQLQKDLDNL